MAVTVLFSRARLRAKSTAENTVKLIRYLLPITPSFAETHANQ